MRIVIWTSRREQGIFNAAKRRQIDRKSYYAIFRYGQRDLCSCYLKRGGYYCTITHNKEKLFAQWGYTVEDAAWLQAEIERQGFEKYVSGDYQLGKLNHNGQRISIRVYIIRRDTGEVVSFNTGWMVHPSGWIQLATPYGGK